MSQDYSLADQPGANFRAELNLTLAQIASTNYGAAEPTTIFPYMLWGDTTNNLLKMRNGANTAWVTIMSLAQATAFALYVNNAKFMDVDTNGNVNFGGAASSSYKLGVTGKGNFTDDLSIAKNLITPDYITIASASTVNIGAAAGNNILISGTTTITAFDTIAAGIRKKVKFTGALTLTHNSTSLILPGGVSITTTAGDVAEFISEGSGNWRCSNYMRADGSPVNEIQGANLASASTVNIGASNARYVKITGTTTITAFDTYRAGTLRIVEFTGALTLTHNATSLILPTGANITTAAGDCAFFVSEGSGNWRCVNYSKGDGTDVLDSTGTFTPTAYGATTAGAPTYTTQVGYYVKQSKKVSYFVRLKFGGSYNGLAGGLRIAGLPFTAIGSYVGQAVHGETNNIAASTYNFASFVQPSTSEIWVYKQASGGTTPFLGTDATNGTITGEFFITGFYFIA